MALLITPNVTQLIATANQTTVSPAEGIGVVTIGTVQNIGTGSSPTFSGLTLSSFTQGSIIFAGSGGLLSQDNANFFWDDTNNRLGIGTATPNDTVEINGNLRFTKDIAITVSPIIATVSASALNISGGAAGTGGNGGALNLSGGANGGGLTSGGTVTVTGGSGLAGGAVNLVGGPGLNGGGIALSAGAGSLGGTAGSITLTAGSSSSTGAGGSVTINSGNSTSGTVGNVVIATGGVGKIGIGTASPNAFLELKGPTTLIVPSFLITAPTLGVAASTELFDVNINLNRTVTFGSGALTTQRAIYIQGPTYAMGSIGPTLDTAATVSISGPPIGSNINITNSYGLLIETRNVTSNVANGIGLVVNAPTGAFISNASATFLGGPVGINTTSPLSYLDVLTTAFPSSMNHVCIDGITRYSTGYWGGTAFTSLPASGARGFVFDYGFSPSSNSTSGTGTLQSLFTYGGTSNNTGTMVNAIFNTTLNGSGTVTAVNSSNAAIITSSGSSNTITTARSYLGSNNIAGTGTISTYIGYDQTFTYQNVAGTTTDTYGMRIGNASKGASYTLTNFYGVDIEDQTATFGGVKIGFYQKGTNLENRFVSNNNSFGQDATAGAVIDVAGKLFIDTNGKITKYNNVTTVECGTPSIVASSKLTTQSAAIAATTIYAVPASGAGFYKINWVASVTRAATTSSVLGGATGFQVTYTDLNDSVVKTSNPTTVSNETSAGNTTATTVSGTRIVYAKASTNIQYAFGYTSVGGTTMQYDLSIFVEAC